jgi:hypothetical protein
MSRNSGQRATVRRTESLGELRRSLARVDRLLAGFRPEASPVVWNKPSAVALVGKYVRVPPLPL